MPTNSVECSNLCACSGPPTGAQLKASPLIPQELWTPLLALAQGFAEKLIKKKVI